MPQTSSLPYVGVPCHFSAPKMAATMRYNNIIVGGTSWHIMVGVVHECGVDCEILVHQSESPPSVCP